MVSREEVYWTYRAVLAREPENEEAYRYHSQHRSFDELRRSLIQSEEGCHNLRDALAANIDGAFSFYQSVIVFLHIPKTGGTSLHRWLCEALNTPYHQVPHSRFLFNYTIAELNQMDFVGGHFSYQEAMALPRAQKIVVATFREPAERLISLYRFFRSHPSDDAGSNLLPLARSLSAKAFFSHPTVRTSHEIDNRYLRTFVEGTYNIDDAAVDRALCTTLALNRMKSLYAFAITENMNRSADHIARSLGIRNDIGLGHFQVTDDFASMDIGFDVVEPVVRDAELDAVMRPLIEFDQKIYDYARASFAESCTE